jgi:hypothetical protein
MDFIYFFQQSLKTIFIMKEEKKMTVYLPLEEDTKRLDNNFSYHAPKDDQTERYEEIREYAKDLALIMLQFCPPSRERSLALTQLEDSVMWANASIARNE